MFYAVCVGMSMNCKENGYPISLSPSPSLLSLLSPSHSPSGWGGYSLRRPLLGCRGRQDLGKEMAEGIRILEDRVSHFTLEVPINVKWDTQILCPLKFLYVVQ